MFECHLLHIKLKHNLYHLNIDYAYCEYNMKNILGFIMRKLWLSLFVVLLTVSLEAYSKKVILASFSTEQGAKNEIKKLTGSVNQLQLINCKGQENIIVNKTSGGSAVISTWHNNTLKRSLSSENNIARITPVDSRTESCVQINKTTVPYVDVIFTTDNSVVDVLNNNNERRAIPIFFEEQT